MLILHVVGDRDGVALTMAMISTDFGWITGRVSPISRRQTSRREVSSALLCRDRRSEVVVRVVVHPLIPRTEKGADVFSRQGYRTVATWIIVPDYLASLAISSQKYAGRSPEWSGDAP